MREYYYLIASLPMLEFGMKLPFAYSEFLSLCREQLVKSDMDIIERVNISPPENIIDNCAALRKWKIFDTTLRNEISTRRAVKRSKDPARYLRGGVTYSDPIVSGFAQWVVDQESPLEAERAIDRIRWERIEELRKGHYFDIDCLITYALQLKILERWENINSETGIATLEKMIEQEVL